MSQVGEVLAREVNRNRSIMLITCRLDSTHNRFFIAAVFACVLAMGCRDVATIWSAESRSPGGQWIAKAQTEAHGGLGTAGVQTSVSLRQNGDANHPTDILLLSYATANPVGITNVDMKWVTQSHLEIGYRGRATVDVQVVRFGGVEVSLRDISSEMTAPSR